MKFFFLLITFLAVSVFAACDRSTSENQNRGMEPVNRNTSPQAEVAPAEVPPAGSDTQPPPSLQPPENKPAQPAVVKLPTFWNPANGEIKDVPSYPGGARMNVQYGPINGIDTAFILLTTIDPVEKIAAFYEKSIKSAGWTVATKVSDSELYKVQLKKGDLSEAMIQVEKDPQTGQRRIILSRLEKPKQPAEQQKQPAEPPKMPNP